MGALFNVTPKPRRRDQALAFIIERIGRTGISPSLDEIGAELLVSKQRAQELVGQLIKAGLVERRPGAQRGLVVRDVAHCRATLEQSYRRLGWSVAEPMGELLPPLTHVKLPVLPPFRHLPEVE